ncbi:MAG: nucleoside triphosphate pyrophosphohydrolase [Eubacteriales bacterium]|nr:nucleoside triphosphate pyrophosphohydrolase [Eubacteriales bacterium]
MKKDRYSYTDLLEIMKILKSEKGCPWDKIQTHDSLKRYLIEETYEVLDAIDKNEPKMLCEELGDVLLQIVFHSLISEENGDFTIADVVDGISRKMVSRHTHVFGNATAKTPGDVLVNWEAIKKKEKGQQTTASVLADVPKNLPALMRSCKVQRIAAKAGFDWDDVEDVFKKIKEETDELKEACGKGDKESIADELGDILFSVVNLARFLNVQPELALTGTTNKFIERFEYVEKKTEENGLKMDAMTLEELDKLWEEAKSILPKHTIKAGSEVSGENHES